MKEKTAFEEYRDLLKAGKLTPELIKQYKLEVDRRIIQDKRKHFKLKDGTEIDLTALDIKEHPKQLIFKGLGFYRKTEVGFNVKRTKEE